MRLLHIIVFSSLSFLFFSPASFAADPPPVVKKMVAKAKKQVRLIDMYQFRKQVVRKDRGLIIDVREPDEFKTGYVPGAINIPRGMIEFNIWGHVGYPDKIRLNTRITLYCKVGGRSALAAKALKDLGFTNITAVDMKIADWQDKKYPFKVPEPDF
jgi:rhodanese-related sulfurtransferase